MGNELDINIKATVMAIRENIMVYFKGERDRFISDANVYMTNLYMPTSYQYERRESQIMQPKRIFIGNAPIMTVSKAPDTVIFHEGVLKRSPEFREVYRYLEEFTEQYLTNVKKEKDNAIIID